MILSGEIIEDLDDRVLHLVEGRESAALTAAAMFVLWWGEEEWERKREREREREKGMQ